MGQILVSKEVETLRTVRVSQKLDGLLKIHRCNPNSEDRTTRVVGFSFPTSKGMTVLDALLWVKEHTDAGLAFRYSCRMGNCGSCGMMINGKPRLACETQISETGNRIEVAPLPGFPLVRDVVADFDTFFHRHSQIKPHLVLHETENDGPPRMELLQTDEQLRDYYQFTMCIMCGLCDSACPIIAGDPEFLGPQALAQAYRFTADSRDRGWKEREKIIDTVHGCWDCKVAGSCSAVCPKGVDPDLGIQLLKRKLLASRFKRGTHP